MADREKVFDALRNCITEPKCKDCPWEDCEKVGCKRVKVPVTLLLDALKLLKEQDNCENCAIAIEDGQSVVRCKDCKWWENGYGLCNRPNFTICVKDVAADALALLKEQEPKTVLHRDDGDYCPQCSTIASRTMGVQKLHLGTHYCPYCGQAVKWE